MDEIVASIFAARDRVSARRALLVAVSGIDASGKGWVSTRLVERLQALGVATAGLGVDGWLRLPPERFDAERPGEHFYRHALRLDEMFAQLVRPLRDRRSVSVEVDHAGETATSYRRARYQLAGVDVIVLEGIFLLKREHRHEYDLSVWVDCSYATALGRAVARAQEGLSAEETVRAYRQIYFPAQEIHAARDAPRSTASLILPNDTPWRGRATGTVNRPSRSPRFAGDLGG